MDNEFEKWHKRFEAKSESAYIHRMAGFKAALEWVLKITEGTFWPLRHKIEQEMKNTQIKPNPD